MHNRTKRRTSQRAVAHEVSEDIKDFLREDRNHILDYFMRIRDLIAVDSCRQVEVLLTEMKFQICVVATAS
jgi:hypothetical protein